MPADLPCQTRPELYFADTQAVLEVARDLCAGCLVQGLCLAGAVERREPHGVWGGLNEFERRQVLRRNALLAG